MSSILDKSLDEILSDKPKKSFNKRRQPAAKSKVTKATVAPKKNATKAKATPAKTSPIVLDASYATKVVVYNLPKDIKYDAVKDFFASQIGGVSHVSLHYNEKGQSKGIANVVFKNSASASKAVEKYNGAPIDGGAQKLKLELVIDPTLKPLASRIAANTAKKETPKKANAKKETPKKAAAPKKDDKKKKNKRPAKKTVEQLDQEMADYFEKKD